MKFNITRVENMNILLERTEQGKNIDSLRAAYESDVELYTFMINDTINTQRDKDIALQVGCGKSAKEVSDHMGISYTRVLQLINKLLRQLRGRILHYMDGSTVIESNAQTTELIADNWRAITVRYLAHSGLDKRYYNSLIRGKVTILSDLQYKLSNNESIDGIGVKGYQEIYKLLIQIGVNENNLRWLKNYNDKVVDVEWKKILIKGLPSIKLNERIIDSFEDVDIITVGDLEDRSKTDLTLKGVNKPSLITIYDDLINYGVNEEDLVWLDRCVKWFFPVSKKENSYKEITDTARHLHNLLKGQGVSEKDLTWLKTCVNLVDNKEYNEQVDNILGLTTGMLNNDSNTSILSDNSTDTCYVKREHSFVVYSYIDKETGAFIVFNDNDEEDWEERVNELKAKGYRFENIN